MTPAAYRSPGRPVHACPRQSRKGSKHASGAGRYYAWPGPSDRRGTPALVRNCSSYRPGRIGRLAGSFPVEVSSGGRKIYRLSLRSNRRLNHAIHMAAISQIRHKHSQGRAYYDKKLAEGKPLPARHHHTARRYRRSRTRSAEPCSSASGRATRGRFEETPANHLTSTAKRTRYGRLGGQRRLAADSNRWIVMSLRWDRERRLAGLRGLGSTWHPFMSRPCLGCEVAGPGCGLSEGPVSGGQDRPRWSQQASPIARPGSLRVVSDRRACGRRRRWTAARARMAIMDGIPPARRSSK